MEEIEQYVVVGGNKYAIVKEGRAQAEQVLNVTRWISNHGVPALKRIQGENGNLDTTNGLEFIGKLLNVLTVDAVIDLFVAVVGCTKEEGELYFDVAVLIDTLVAVYERQPSVRRLIERFFSTPDSEEPKQEG